MGIGIKNKQETKGTVLELLLQMRYPINRSKLMVII